MMIRGIYYFDFLLDGFLASIHDLLNLSNVSYENSRQEANTLQRVTVENGNMERWKRGFLVEVSCRWQGDSEAE